MKNEIKEEEELKTVKCRKYYYRSRTTIQLQNFYEWPVV